MRIPESSPQSRSNRVHDGPSVRLDTAHRLPVQVATAHAEVPFGARQLSAANGVLARRSVLQVWVQIGSYVLDACTSTSTVSTPSIMVGIPFGTP
jgi:hypothetical protein